MYIPACFEDEQFIIFRKPAGLLVVPTPRGETRTLEEFVNQQYAYTETRLYPCHRLDRETSGLIIFAKGPAHQQTMMDLFKARRITKRYLAFALGVFAKPSGTWRDTIRHLELAQRDAEAGGKEAVTHFKVVEQFSPWALVEMRPVTGRTNQLRIQSAQHGHPLLGERKYSVAREHAVKFRRVALHAAGLEFEHPITHKMVRIEASLPEDMKQFLDAERSGRGSGSGQA